MTIYDSNVHFVHYLHESGLTCRDFGPISAPRDRKNRGNCRLPADSIPRAVFRKRRLKGSRKPVMYPALIQRVLRRAALAAAIAACAITVTSASDWPEWRGPSRDGRSTETNLPAKWSPKGENLAWRIPIGSRSSPVAFGNRLYLNSPVGDPANTQERLVAIDAETGKVVWEKRFSLYLSDVPQHRASWASPAVDPETGNIYMFTVAAQLICVAPDGKVLWDRSLPDEYGAVTTHGGRTTSPIVEGDKVILNALILAWGDLNRTGNRYFAFDKKTGQTVWISSPQARHYDTNYSTPIVAHHRRHARADRRRHRRRVSRAQGQHRREDLVDRSQQARHSQQRALQGQRRLHHARRREHGHDGDGHDRRRRCDARAGTLGGRRLQVAHARLPADVRVAGDGRRAALHRRQQRHRRRVRSEDRREAVGEVARHAAEGIAGARRRQAVCRHRERQVLHPAAVGDRRRSARRGSARHGADAGADRRVADRRRRPHLRDVDGSDLRDRQARSAQGVRSGATGATGATSSHCVRPQWFRCSRTNRSSRPDKPSTLKARLFDAKGNFIREEPARAVVGRSVERRGGCEGRLHRGGAGIERRIREGDGGRPERHGARARRRAAAVDV